MGVSKVKSSTGGEYSRLYSALGGVDLTGNGSRISENRFAFLENMYRDYDGDGPGVLESIPGFRRLKSFPARINAIFSYKASDTTDYTVIHAGTKLYRFPTEERDALGELAPIATLCDTESHAFVSEYCLYILDGESILRIDGDGLAATVGGDLEPYIPITYYNGEPYEQRNLLTERFIEQYYIPTPDSVAAASAGLVYRVTDAAKGFCALASGFDAYGAVYIPSRTEIDGVSYLVTEIDPYAFANNKNISIVSIPEGVEKIGTAAFFECTVISRVYLPSTLKEIGAKAFYRNIDLRTLYIGAGLALVGEGAFANTHTIDDAHYALDEESFAAISGVSELAGLTVTYNSTYAGMRVQIPVYSIAGNITDITCNDESVYYNGGPITKRINGENVIVAYEFTVENKHSITGATVKITGTYHKNIHSLDDFTNNFFVTESSYEKSGAEAILGCRLCESFDGRVFLAANPLLPNTVFYSCRDRTGKNNPTYFGVFNYFSDGTGKFSVTSLLATGDSLAVFKSGDDGGGSIYYHEARETADNIMPKVYPVSYIHRGFHSLGASISFFDDPVFVSSLGLCALDKRALYLERSIACRSHNVNAKLLSEDLSRARLAKWCGYLVLSVGGNMYLADSRAMFTHPSGNNEYEWYLLTGIGTYKNARVVYRYASAALPGYEILREEIDRQVCEEVYSEYCGDVLVYFIKRGGVKYAVAPTEESEGGEFFAAGQIYSDGTLLFFGTECGDLCVFNNDKRSVAPDRIRAASAADAEEYAADRPGRIHPEFYSFAGRAVRYGIKTPLDNCGVPHLSKDTVRGSLVVKLKSFTNSHVTLEVGTDRGSYREVGTVGGGELSFTDIDFSSFSFDNKDSENLPFKEKEKRWTEKQIAIYSEDFCSPIGIYTLAYRFGVRGKIKNN